MYFEVLALMLHLVLVAQAGTKLDYAVVPGSGASLGDCLYSLTHEHALNAQYLLSYKLQKKVAICENDATKCDKTLQGWKQILCVQRVDAYYKADHVPPYGTLFNNSHGTCLYNAYSNNAGGFIDFKTRCECLSVGKLGIC